QTIRLASESANSPASTVMIPKASVEPMITARRPTRSAKGPSVSAPSIRPTSPAVPTHFITPPVSCQSLAIAGLRLPITWVSNPSKNTTVAHSAATRICNALTLCWSSVATTSTMGAVIVLPLSLASPAAAPSIIPPRLALFDDAAKCPVGPGAGGALRGAHGDQMYNGDVVVSSFRSEQD